MLRKTGIVFSMLIMGSTFVFAAPSVNFDEGINGSLNTMLDEHDKFDKALDKALNEKVAANNPLEVYREQLAQVKKPSYETLLPVLQNLTEYNKEFATVKDEDKLNKLAFEISFPAKAGWNSYRKIGIKEIFDSYWPEEQNNEEMSLLEYNLRVNSMPKDQINNRKLLDRTEFAAKFLKEFEEFSKKMQSSKKYNGAKIIKELVPVIEAYNDMVKDVPASDALVKSSVFRTPIACGWGRTQSIEDLRGNLGIVWFASGDAYKYRDAESLQAHFPGLGLKQASVFAKFVSTYYIWAGK